MADLPLLLAGPIVRRVESKSASVWVALRDPCSVELTLWEGDVTSTSDAGELIATERESFDTAAADTMRIGEKLHLALVTWEGTDATFLKRGTRYAYNVTFTPKAGGDAADLSSVGLLKTEADAAAPVEALGYTDKMLPTFVTVPDELLELTIAHGSCRKPFGSGDDALAFLDKVIEENRTTVAQRPQQLFLTGDQIYADEVAEMLLPAIVEVGHALIGTSGDRPRERVAVTIPNEDQQLWPADLKHFPAARRQNLVRDAAGFTSSHATSHLLSFGEFCAMYLFAWSNVVWPETLAAKESIYEEPSGDVPAVHELLTPLEELDELKEAYEARRKEVEQFRKALPKARRVLANTATYMLSDDHEVTDDWYLTDLWRHQVLSTTLGRYVLGNALGAYGLFQAWGNDPKAFGTGKNKEFLEKVTELFPEGTDGPVDAAHAALQTLVGMVDDPLATPEEFVRWYFSVGGPKHTVIGLDTRNWRKGRSLHSPPELIARSMMEKQIADSTRPEEKEVTFVISPVPVLGLPTIEEIIQKAYTLILDVKKAFGSGVGAAGKDPEPWGYDPYAVENLFERLRGHERIVFLSGDVHYALSAEMDYWQKGEDDELEAAARFVQFTSSALKNVENSLITLASVPIAQFVFENLEAPLARLVWDEDDPPPVTPPDGGRLPARFRNRLDVSPVLLGTKGWPPGSSLARTPDRAWRFRLIRDGRADGERPPPVRHIDLTEDFDPEGDPAAISDAYAEMLARHHHSLRRSDPRLVLFDSNVGVVSFERATSLTLTEAALSQIEAEADLPDDVVTSLTELKDRPILEENFGAVLKAHLGVQRGLTVEQANAIKEKASSTDEILTARHRLLSVHPQKPDEAAVYTQQITSLDLTTEPPPTIEIVEDEEDPSEPVPA